MFLVSLPWVGACSAFGRMRTEQATLRERHPKLPTSVRASRGIVFRADGTQTVDNEASGVLLTAEGQG